jgi:hypothetical protein
MERNIKLTREKLHDLKEAAKRNLKLKSKNKTPTISA